MATSVLGIKDLKSTSNNSRPSGDPFVWMTSMGLTLGLAMILFLLGLIFVKGVEVFWPDEVVTVTLKEDSVSKIEGSNQISGAIRKKQEKVIRVVDANEPNRSNQEWQLFVGNKDLYGFSFFYFDVADKLSVSYPKDIMRLERLEYGDAIVYPVALKLENEDVIDASDKKFAHILHSEVEHVLDRWKEIKHIEKKDIGRINYDMQKLNVKRQGLERRGGSSSSAKIAQIDEKMAVLEADYQVLATEAKALRAAQTANKFIFRTQAGNEGTLSVGDIVHFYYPNQLNFWDRAQIFFHKIAVFISTDPREANTEGGVFPAIFGTFVMTVLMSIAVMPFGVVAAIYLREYAKQGFFVRSVRIAVNNLAGVPSIVFGVFGLGFFVYFVGGGIDSLFFKDALPTPTFGTGGILWASLTLALMTVPVVIVATEEALAAVPRGMREGSLACGASKWQTIQKIVLPAAAPGILTGLVLAMARGASEVAPLMIVGVVKLAPNLPLDGIFPYFHLERKFMHLGFHIFDLGFQSPDSEAAKPMVFATTLLLITLVVFLNLGAIYIRDKLRKKYATGAF